MIHVNCVAYDLNRVAEKVVENFLELNSVISLGKQVLIKTPLRRQLILEAGLTLAPEPINTRWGTWIQATKYYLDNYEAFLLLLII